MRIQSLFSTRYSTFRVDLDASAEPRGEEFASQKPACVYKHSTFVEVSWMINNIFWPLKAPSSRGTAHVRAR